MNRAALIAMPLAALALAAVPALARNSVNIQDTGAKRSITIQNRSHHEITHAKVQTTPDGRVWNLSQGGVRNNGAAEIVVPARDCIANVRVTLNNGRVLQLAGLHDCRDTQVAVRDNRIWIPKIAVPGAQQHGTPG